MKLAVFHNLHYGGAKRALYGFVRYLAEAGHEIYVFVPETADEKNLPLKPYARAVRVFPSRANIFSALFQHFNNRVPLYYILHPRVRALSALHACQKLIAGEINRAGVDVAILEQDGFICSPFVLRYLSIPNVYYCPQPLRVAHETVLQRLEYDLFAHQPFGRLRCKLWRIFVSHLSEIDKLNAGCAQRILTNSYFSHEAIFRAYGLNARVSYLGVDTELFKPNGKERQNFLLSVGAMIPSKGFDFLVMSLACMNPARRPKLVIVSNQTKPNYLSYLQNLARQNNVSLQVMQAISDEELVGLYNQAMLFVYAPYLEPFGLAPLEAMACGTPVVAVREGGMRETILDNKTGLLVDRDPEVFAGAVEQLLADSAKRREMSRNGREWVLQQWTLGQAGERLTQHLLNF